MGRTSIIALGIALMLVAWWIVSVESVPRSHAEAIAGYLRTRDVPVRNVNVTQPWPNALPFYAYGDTVVPYQASISVELLSGHRVSGFMVCTAAPFGCAITIREFAVLSEAIPDIRTDLRLRDWVRAQWAKLITL